MPAYANRSGSSGVISYEIGGDWIRITFAKGRTYTYTRQSCGTGHLEAMKRLARQGYGLAGYVSRHKPTYA